MSKFVLRGLFSEEVKKVVEVWAEIHRRTITPYAVEDLAKSIADVAFIREDLEEIVPTWSTINGLYLTPGQITALIARLIQTATLEITD